MASASVIHYDGTAGTLIDTNVWVDCMDQTSPWHNWALDHIQSCGERAPLHTNVIIYAELLVQGLAATALDAVLDVYDTLRSPLPWSSAALAAAAHSLYRRRGGSKTKPMPDFFIGAHAAVANLSVLTRDPVPYRSYFARLAIVGP